MLVRAGRKKKERKTGSVAGGGASAPAKGNNMDEDISEHQFRKEVQELGLGGERVPVDGCACYLPLHQETDASLHWQILELRLMFTGTDGPSGFGFELTFRLKRETGESAPPTWPAELMQGLARYVFQSENTFCSGDHVSWHNPLDNSESRIQHMLLTEDPQMQPVQTPFGVVTFLQIVGVCTEELHAAQQWNGQGILELLRTVPVAGGPWLITDMRRGETIFEIDPHLQRWFKRTHVQPQVDGRSRKKLEKEDQENRISYVKQIGSSHAQKSLGVLDLFKQERVDKGIETDGSNLSGVSAKCAWDDLSRPPEDDEDSRSICIGTQPRRLSGKDTEQIRETLRRGLEINSKPVLPPINAQRQNGLNHDRAPSRKDSLESESSAAIIPHELIRTRQLESVHLKFNQESGALIPLCLRKEFGEAERNDLNKNGARAEELESCGTVILRSQNLS
ncbi:Suppressor of fused like protein [Pitangus sulphuratus]|nr:Suppressor of fused like protein [Pitangus sulphuratus]